MLAEQLYRSRCPGAIETVPQLVFMAEAIGVLTIVTQHLQRRLVNHTLVLVSHFRADG
jgi:hypothetical protein